MDNLNELSLEQMENAVGGVQRTVNTGASINAAVRSGPTKGKRQIASLANGTVINTVSDQLVYDPVSGRNFVEITFIDKRGRKKTGWIASSLVGMKR